MGAIQSACRSIVLTPNSFPPTTVESESASEFACVFVSHPFLVLPAWGSQARSNRLSRLCGYPTHCAQTSFKFHSSRFFFFRRESSFLPQPLVVVFVVPEYRNFTCDSI